MKSIRKALSLVVALTIVSSLFALPLNSVYAQDETAPQKAYKWLFSDDFNSYDIGQMPPSSVISTYGQKGNLMGIAPVPTEKNRSINIKIRSRDDSLMHTKSFQDIGGVSGQFVVEMALRIDDSYGCAKNFYMYNAQESSTSSTTTWTVMSISGSNRITFLGKDTGITIPEGKFTTLSFAIDTDKKEASLYVNHKLRVPNSPLPEGAKNMATMRVHLTSVGEGCKTSFYFDDFKVYEGPEALIPEEIAAYDWNAGNEISEGLMEVYMANKLAFFVNGSQCYVDGKVSSMNGTSGKVTAIKKGDVSYIPVKYGAEAFGGKVLWDDKTKTTSFTINNKKVEILTSTGEVKVDGEKREGTNDVFLENGRTYVSSKLFSEISGKNLWEETGIILFSDIEVDYNWYDDDEIIKELIASLCYERPTGDKVEQDLRAKHPVGQHPRIWATAADFERVKQEIATSEIKKGWFEQIKNYTDTYVNKIEFPEYGTTDGIRMRAHCERLFVVVGYNAFIYRITGDESYAEYAYEWLEKMGVGYYADWNHNRHWLDTGCWMKGYGVGYDWLYDWMNEEQRKHVRDTIVKFGFEPYLKSTWYTSTMSDNWNSVIQGGLICSALAIMDEEPEISKKCIQAAIKNMENTVLLAAPDGACYEGPSYWQLTTESMVEGMSALETSTGTSYGLAESPGMAETGYFLFALSGKYTINYGDAGPIVPTSLDTKELFWLAEKAGDVGLRNLRYKTMIENNIVPHFREMLACVGDPETETSELSLDRYYRIIETVSIRNSWDTESMLWGGLHAGETDVTHGHLDTGNFYIDSFGDRFAYDLGIEDYNLAGGGKYRHRAEGHNMLVFNPDDQLEDILKTGYSKIERFEHNDVSAIVTTNTTGNYSNYAENVERGMRFVNGRTSIVVQDEVKSERENEVYWFMHTPAKVTLSEDGKTAILDIKGNRMEAKLLSDVGKFEVMEAKPLPTSPNPVGQNKNEGYCKLAIHLENVKDFTISVCFTPLVYTPVGGTIKYPEVTPMAQWELEDPEKVSVGVLPRLDSLKIDGKDVVGFRPDMNFYVEALKKADSSIPNIEATGDGKVEIIPPAEWPGSVEIKISNGVFENVYGIRFNVPPRSLADEGYVELDIEEVTASSVPQEANPPKSAFDNDFETRFSVQQPGWICMDLGEAKSIHYLSMAFYLGNTRANEFYVEVSEDGTSWTKVWQGRDGGTSTELQNFDLKGVSARWVRITGTGIVNPGSDTAVQGWFSPTEIKLYTK